MQQTISLLITTLICLFFFTHYRSHNRCPLTCNSPACRSQSITFAIGRKYGLEKPPDYPLLEHKELILRNYERVKLSTNGKYQLRNSISLPSDAQLLFANATGYKKLEVHDGYTYNIGDCVYADLSEYAEELKSLLSEDLKSLLKRVCAAVAVSVLTGCRSLCVR